MKMAIRNEESGEHSLLLVLFAYKQSMCHSFHPRGWAVGGWVMDMTHRTGAGKTVQKKGRGQVTGRA